MTALSAVRSGRWGRWRWSLGRLLLFTGLFGVLWIAGLLMLPGVDAESDAGLALASTVMLIAAFVAGAILLRLDRRPPGALGLAWTRSVPAELAVGLAIGTGAIAVAALLLAAGGGLRYVGQAGSAGGWLASSGRSFSLLAVPAFAEEVLFRGYAFQVVAAAAGPVVATVAGSAVFAAAHASNPDLGPLAVGNIFLAGVLLSAAYLRTRSLWFAGAVHLGWNWGMAGPLDLPVSGLDFLDTPLYEPVVSGAGWLTGGAFGPEGGVVGTLAFGLALLAVVTLPGLREAPTMKALRPLVDPDETEERDNDG